MARALTQIAIDNLKPGPARREIPDGKETGLYFVIQPTGRRTWAFRYRFNGKPRKLTVGPYPAIGLGKARAEAIKAKSAIASGNDPGVEKQAAKATARRYQTSDTVERTIRDFISLYAQPNTRDWRETQRLLAEFGAAWNGRPLADIGKADIHRVLDAVVARGSPVTANRKFSQLRKLCKWAVSRGLIDHSPCQGIEAPSTETARDRVLSLDELKLVWSAADSLGYPFSPIVKLLILTGQRRSEVGEMEWAEIDLENRLWTIPAARSKNRRQHTIPLSPQVLEILKGLPRFSGLYLSSPATAKKR